MALTASLLFQGKFPVTVLSDGFFAAGLRKTPQGRLFAREFRENLVELGNLENLFHSRRQADHFQLPVHFHHRNINPSELADPRAVQVFQTA